MRYLEENGFPLPGGVRRVAPITSELLATLLPAEEGMCMLLRAASAWNILL